MNRQNTVGHVFACPFIFGLVCFSLIPVCISFYYAFTNYSLGSKQATFIGVTNFLRLLQDEVFLKSLAITLKYVVISVPLKLAFALLVAYLLTRSSRMVTFYRSLYYLPSLVGGSVAVALVWKQGSVQQRAGRHGAAHHQLVRRPEARTLPVDSDERLAVRLLNDHLCRRLKGDPRHLL